MSYTKLFFDNITQVYTSTNLSLDPNFPKCPNCGALNVRLINKPNFTFQANKVYNFNQLLNITMPCCGAIMSLFVAVHKESNGVLMLRYQKSDEEGSNGIPSDWWQKFIQP